MGSVKTLGGRFVREVDNGRGGFVVCSDLDGNEFCLVSPKDQ